MNFERTEAIVRLKVDGVEGGRVVRILEKDILVKFDPNSARLLKLSMPFVLLASSECSVLIRRSSVSPTPPSLHVVRDGAHVSTHRYTPT